MTTRDRVLPVLGTYDAFASMTELAAYLGGSVSPPHDQRRALALITASRWVAYRVGVPVENNPDESIPPGDVEPVAVACPPAWRAATLVVATRFYRAPDAVFGAMGGLGDDAVYVRASIPEAELLLVGQTVSWGYRVKGTAARALVAQLLAGAVPPTFTVHAEPTSSPASPCVVVAPRRPFRTLTTGCIESVGLAVTTVLNIATEDVWDVMDDLVEEQRAQLETDPRVVVESVEDMGTILNISGVDHLTARLDVSVFMQ